MRLALLTYSTRPRGGVVHTLALAEALAAEGVDVTVATISRDGSNEFFRPVDPSVRRAIAPMEDIDGESFGDRIERSIQTLSTACDWSEFDVVHAQDCISANAVEQCVRTVHHLDQFTTPQLVACHERAIVRPTGHVCVSRAVASELKRGWGIDATVIPNGVAAGRFRSAADDVAAQNEWRARIGGPFVVSVGGVEPRKGTLGLIEAWPTVKAERPDVRLVIAGGETLFDYREYREQVERRWTELEVEPVLLGPVDHEALPSLVAAAAALAMPSVKEGFGLAAMEALAAGTSVALSNLVVFEEVFGEVAWFPDGDSPESLGRALLAAIEDNDPSRIEAGRRLAADHSWRRAALSHLDYYESHRDRVRPTAN